MANLLTWLRQKPEISRYSLSDYIRQITSGYGLTQQAISYTAGGKPAERIPNSYVGYAEQAYGSSSVVGACMRVRRDTFRQAKFAWREITQDGTGKLKHDDGLALLEKPWPNGTTGELLAKMITDVDLCGNSFVVNEGDRLRWRRPDWMYVVLSGDPLNDYDVDVVGYVYCPGGTAIGDGKPYLVDEVCHWSPIPHPTAEYVGMSWMTPALKDIQGDIAATDHKNSFFRNGTTLGPIFRLPATMTPDQFEKFKRITEQTHTGEHNAYRTLYVGGGAEVTLAASTFQQLELKATQGGGETRIAALAGCHPAIVGLSEGLQGSSLNAGNFSAARRVIADITLFALWQDACAALSTFVEVPDGFELWIREQAIPLLREDAKDAADIEQVRASTITILVREGFTAESAVAATMQQDMRVLEHTGMTSVQLQPPGTTGPETVVEEEFEPIDFGALRSDIYRRFDPSQRRAPAGTPIGGEWIRDVLQLGTRIDLDEGETFAGSDVIEGADGDLLTAWTVGPNGRSLRLGVGIADDDRGRWRAANRGSTVVLDEDGQGRLRSALREMESTAGQASADARATVARVGELEATRRAAVRRQYPRLSGVQASEFDELQVKIAGAEGRAAYGRRSIDGMVQRLDAADRGAYQRVTVDLDRAERDRAAAEQAVNDAGGFQNAPDELVDRHFFANKRILQLVDEQRAIMWGLSPEELRDYDTLRFRPFTSLTPAETDRRRAYNAKSDSGRGVFYDQRVAEIENQESALRRMRTRHGELTAEAVPQSPTDAAEIARLDAEIARLEATLPDDSDLVAGTIPAQWGDLAYSTHLDEDFDPRYFLAVAANRDTTDDLRLSPTGLRHLSKLLGDDVARAVVVRRRDFYGDAPGERIAPGHKGGGRFRKLTDRLTDVLEDWVKGEGPDDPLDGFSREQLRETAKKLADKARGAGDNDRAARLTPRRGASTDEIKLALYQDIRAGRRGGRDVPEGKAEPKTAPEPRKVTPAKKAAPKAPDVDLSTLDDPEALRDALDLRKVPELKDMLREAGLPVSGRKRELVDRLVEQRGGGIDKPAAKKAGSTPPAPDAPPPSRFPAGQNSWSGHDGRDVTDEEERDFLSYPLAKKAEIDGRIKGTRFGAGIRTAFFGSHPDRSTSVSAEREAEIRAAVESIAPASGFVALKDLRESLGDRFERVEVDNVLQALNRSGDWHVVADANQKSLTPRSRLAAVVIGNQDKHAVRVVRRAPAKPDAPASPADVVLPRPFTNEAAGIALVEADVRQQIADMVSTVDWEADNGGSTRALVFRVRAQMRRLRLHPQDTPDGGVRYVWRRPDGDVPLDPVVAPIPGPDVGTTELNAARTLAALATEIETAARAGVSGEDLKRRVRARLDGLDGLDGVAKPPAKSSGRALAGKAVEVLAPDENDTMVPGRSALPVVGTDLTANPDYDFDALPPTYDMATNTDSALREILRQQGFDGRPVVVSAADFDAAVKRGEVRETWRGISGSSPYTSLSAEQMAEEFRTGPLHAGTGINGNGTYVAIRKIDGQYYGTTLLRIGLRSDARVISADDLDAEMDEYFSEYQTNLRVRNLDAQLAIDLAKARSPRARANIRRAYRSAIDLQDRERFLAIQRDPGRFAALRGYDAVDIPRDRSPDKHAEMIILNRTAVIVEAAQ